MGDRGNIVIVDADNKPQLYFYTHWSGSDLPELVKAGLINGKSRWEDPPYLNRILFQTMLSDDKDITGFGIDTRMGDGGTEVFICHEKQTVKLAGCAPYSFEEYIKLESFGNVQVD